MSNPVSPTMPTSSQAPPIDLVELDHYEHHGVPHDQLSWLRENDPVHWHPDPNPGVPGFWAVTRHADVVHVSRRSELFSSYERLALFHEPNQESLEMNRLMMLFMDPPEHTARRLLVNKGFTPRMIRQLEGHIRDVARELVGEVVARGAADFVADIAAPLPSFMICELLGMPVEDRERIFRWSNLLIGGDDPEFHPDAATRDQGMTVAMEVMAYAGEIAALRRENPRDDIVTQLLLPDEEGRVLTDVEFQLFVLLLLVAGNETTRNSAAGGMLAFFDHPDQWRRLLSDRSLLRTAPDEIVRWVTPVNMFRRTAMRDTEISGTKVAAGDKVVLFYASANRDERVLDDPFTFDIGRDPNPHLGFGGGGAHFCLGSHLARLTLSVLFETVVEQMPDIRPAGPARRLRSNFIHGLKELPVEFTPTERVGL
jgi:cholest-4-en-3-one 26-monooxygenase